MPSTQELINILSPEGLGIEKLTPFNGGSLGFSLLKKLPNEKRDGYFSQLGVHVSEVNSKATSPNRKSLVLRATYGKLSEDNDDIYIRQNPTLFEPLDIENSTDYYYDINTNEVYENSKRIEGSKILSIFYQSHVKSTKPFKGLWIRIKILFWKYFLYYFFERISAFFRWVLYTLSGIHYSYEPFFETEKINGRITKSKINDIQVNEVKEEGRKIQFFNFEVKYWPIIVYCLLHAIVYSIMIIIPFKPIYITTIFKNNFLTVVYVILSLSIFETGLPKILILFVKFFSRISFSCQNKNLKV